MLCKSFRMWWLYWSLIIYNNPRSTLNMTTVDVYLLGSVHPIARLFWYQKMYIIDQCFRTLLSHGT
ncbi:protein of unknown function [Candidatus Nitrosocosmicus franklandus]|uniref:Uncharacterized protein n=1 Tax=Candidatus Nitrosocosmicus franklandianus TaxID=1798806 RepID=A0A484IF86_9ARCH|nr:protein of unknown function [Candidatus Nitrosocosmicus franklandus]